MVVVEVEVMVVVVLPHRGVLGVLAAESQDSSSLQGRFEQLGRGSAVLRDCISSLLCRRLSASKTRPRARRSSFLPSPPPVSCLLRQRQCDSLNYKMNASPPQAVHSTCFLSASYLDSGINTAHLVNVVSVRQMYTR